MRCERGGTRKVVAEGDLTFGGIKIVINLLFSFLISKRERGFVYAVGGVLCLRVRGVEVDGFGVPSFQLKKYLNKKLIFLLLFLMKGIWTEEMEKLREIT